MVQLTITGNDAGQRLDRFLRKVYPKLPAALMYKYIRIKRIKIGGSRTDRGYILREGDSLELYVCDHLLVRQERSDFKKAGGLNIVYEDDNIIVINKPAGLLCHSDATGDDSLVPRVLKYLWSKGEYDPAKENSFAPALCNRIDRSTSGLVAAAKNAESLRMLALKIKNREISRFYICRAEGVLSPEQGRLSAYYKKDTANNKAIVSEDMFEGAVKAELDYRLLSHDGRDSLVEAELITGKSHQIRAQFSLIGHPLLGDRKYGGRVVQGSAGQSLCAYKIGFDFTQDGGILEYLRGQTFSLDIKECGGV